jgi:hypothetical protein
MSFEAKMLGIQGNTLEIWLWSGKSALPLVSPVNEKI